MRSEFVEKLITGHPGISNIKPEKTIIFQSNRKKIVVLLNNITKCYDPAISGTIENIIPLNKNELCLIGSLFSGAIYFEPEGKKKRGFLLIRKNLIKKRRKNKNT